jgi:hypothetical protein
LFEPVDLRDVRVIERGERLCFTRKSRDAIGVAGKGVGQNLDRDVAIQLRIARALHFAHAAGTERRQNFVRTKASAVYQRHRRLVADSLQPSVVSRASSVATGDWRLATDD